jgi:hypothetical protein
MEVVGAHKLKGKCQVGKYYVTYELLESSVSTTKHIHNDEKDTPHAAHTPFN